MHRNLYKLLKYALVILMAVSFVQPAYCQDDKKNNAKDDRQRIPKEAQMAMVEANRAMEKEDYPLAIEELKKYLNADPKPEIIPEDLYRMLAYCYRYLNKLDDAIKVAKEANSVYPDDVDILTLYAVVLYEAEKFSESAPKMEKIYEIMPKKDIKFLEYAMGCYYNIEKIEEAKRVLRRMISLVEKPDEKWYNNLIQMCMEQEKYDEAQKEIFNAMKFYPMNYKYWEFLGGIRQAKEDMPGFMAATDIAYYIEKPKKKEEWERLVNLYRGYAFTPLRAAKVQEKFLGIKEKVTDEDHILMAKLYAQAFKTDEAIKYIDKVIAERPSVDLMYEKVMILYNARRNKETIKAVDELSEFDAKKTKGEAYIMQGNAAWDMEDWKAAKEAFKKAKLKKETKEYAEDSLSFIELVEKAKNKIEYPAYYRASLEK